MRINWLRLAIRAAAALSSSFSSAISSPVFRVDHRTAGRGEPGDCGSFLPGGDGR